MGAAEQEVQVVTVDPVILANGVTIPAIGFAWRSLRDQIREVHQRLNDTNTHLIDVDRRLARVEGVLSVQQTPVEADSQ